MITWPPLQNERYGDGEHVEKLWRFCPPCPLFAKIWPYPPSLLGLGLELGLGIVVRLGLGLGLGLGIVKLR